MFMPPGPRDAAPSAAQSQLIRVDHHNYVLQARSRTNPGLEGDCSSDGLRMRLAQVVRRGTALLTHRTPGFLLSRNQAPKLVSRAWLSTSPGSNPEEIYERGLDALHEGRLSVAIDDFAGAAALGSPGGNFHLGLAYDGLLGRDAADELPIEPNAAAAARCYQRAAEAGHEMAMLNLSFCYRNGEGVDGVDIAEAWKWLANAAAAGSDRAQFNAALALDPLHPPYGTPGIDMVAKDATKAVALYRDAVAQDHEKAKVNLGICYYTGTGCDQDLDAAVALWKEAQKAGVPQADNCLRNMEEKPGEMKDYFK